MYTPVTLLRRAIAYIIRKFPTFISVRVCFTLCIVLFLVTTVYIIRRKDAQLLLELKYYQQLVEQRMNSSNLCVIPVLNPWDKSIIQYYEKPPPLKCNEIQPNIAILQDGVLKISKSYENSVTCRSRTFTHHSNVSDFDVLYDQWRSVHPHDGLRIDGEYVEVECRSNGIIPRTMFTYHWNQVIRRNKSSISNLPFGESGVHSPSVLLLGFDSLSRSNFIRVLPKTYAQMQKMNFVDMKHHVKVYDNTYGNMIAILTGLRGASSQELKAELNEDWDIYFDDFPFIWKEFSKNGYATLFAEDRPDIGTFNYRGWLNGFLRQPTDHYFRPYWLAAYYSLLFRRSTPFCYSSIPAHKLQLNYLQDFIRKYDGTRSFALSWTQDMSHDYLNKINVADEDFAHFLNINAKYLSKTIVMVIADHGNRYDKIRGTVVGRLESRLPILSIRLPDDFITKFPNIWKTLQENSQKFTTQFDVHATLTQIVKADFRPGDVPKKIQRAYSLFRPHPPTRTCLDANVPDDYCPCYNELSISPFEAKIASEQLVGLINKEITDHSSSLNQKSFKCLPLQLKSIVSASVRLPPSKVIQDPHHNNRFVTSNGFTISYRLVVQMASPSDAILEATVMKDLGKGEWSWTKEVERNNKYGNTSHCVVDPLLKKICYCVKVNA